MTVKTCKDVDPTLESCCEDCHDELEEGYDLMDVEKNGDEYYVCCLVYADLHEDQYE